MKASDLLDKAAGDMIDLWKDPAARAGFIAAMATTVVCERLNMRMVPSVLFGLAAFYGTERACLILNDMHQAALEIRAAAAVPGLPDAEHSQD